MKVNTEIILKILQSLIITVVIVYGAHCILNAFIDKLFGTVVTLVIFVIVQILDKLLKTKLSAGIKTATIIMVFLTIFLGETLDFYQLLKHWDKAIHLLSGGLFVWYFLKIYLSKFSNSKLYILAIIYAVGLAGMWEIVEYLADSFFYTNMQCSKLIYQNGLEDTMQDIIACLIGAVLVSGFWFVKNKFGKNISNEK